MIIREENWRKLWIPVATRTNAKVSRLTSLGQSDAEKKKKKIKANFWPFADVNNLKIRTT